MLTTLEPRCWQDNIPSVWILPAILLELGVLRPVPARAIACRSARFSFRLPRYSQRWPRRCSRGNAFALASEP